MPQEDSIHESSRIFRLRRTVVNQNEQTSYGNHGRETF